MAEEPTTGNTTIVDTETDTGFVSSVTRKRYDKYGRLILGSLETETALLALFKKAGMPATPAAALASAFYSRWFNYAPNYLEEYDEDGNAVELTSDEEKESFEEDLERWTIFAWKRYRHIYDAYTDAEKSIPWKTGGDESESRTRTLTDNKEASSSSTRTPNLTTDITTGNTRTDDLSQGTKVSATEKITHSGTDTDTSYPLPNGSVSSPKGNPDEIMDHDHGEVIDTSDSRESTVTNTGTVKDAGTNKQVETGTETNSSSSSDDRTLNDSETVTKSKSLLENWSDFLEKMKRDFACDMAEDYRNLFSQVY